MDKGDESGLGVDVRAANAIRLLAMLKQVGISESWLVLTMHDVDREIVHSLEKHGRPTIYPERGIAHCAEELGEAAKEATDATRGAAHEINCADPAALRRMYTELCQLSAYSALLATSMRLLAKEIEDGRNAK